MAPFGKTWALRLLLLSSSFAKTAGDDCTVATTFTIESAVYAAIAGCYSQSEYTSLGKQVYTNDGGDVVNGTTLAILGSFVSVWELVPEGDSSKLLRAVVICCVGYVVVRA